MPSSLKRPLRSSESESSDYESASKANVRKRSRVPSIQQTDYSDEEANKENECDLDTEYYSNDNDEDELDEEEEEEEEEEEDKLLSQYNSINNSRSSDISESGTIAKIEVINFMCHKYLKMDFGPKINFVIGHNGSGKSAILTALVVALGAKANSTNRGKKLGELIREGASAALVTIHITNKGPDAYKHDIYGDRIIVDRRLARDGSNTFKIKNSKGKVISTKREELTAICDHMSIQVDNPLTMLSQDNARQFLNSSSSHDKYKLFMRGTQLAQLATDFDKIRETLETTDSTIKRKSEHLPLLHRKAKEAEMKYKELLESSELDNQIDVLNNELVWSQIIRKEKDLEAAKRATDRCEQQVSQVDEQIQVAKSKISRFQDEIHEMQEQLKAYRQNNPPDTAKRNLLNERKTEWTRKSNDLKNDMRETNSEFKKYKDLAKACQKEIAEATAKLESNNRQKIQQINDKIEQLEMTKEQLLQQANSLKQQREEAENDYTEKRNLSLKLQEKYDGLQQNYRESQHNLTRLQAQKENKLKAFGQKMPEALQDITNERRWRGQPPVGPFGQYMNLKYPEYAEVLEITLGNQLSNFAVETFEDQALLKRILARHDLGRCNIMVAKKDLFDYSSDEPDQHLLTILRAIDFDNEYVKRQLIIANSIHQVILMAERAEAEELMTQQPTNVKACFTKDCQNVGAKSGMRTESLRRHKGPTRFKKDVESDIREIQKEMSQFIQQQKAVKESIITTDKELKTIRASLNDLKENLRQVETRINRNIQDITHLQETLKDNEPANLGALEEDLDDYEKKSKQLLGVYKALKADEADLAREANELQEEINQLDDNDEEISRRIAGFLEGIQKLEGLLHAQKGKLITDESTRTNRYNRYQQALEDQQQLDNTIAEWTRQAMEDYPNRVETERKPEEIQRNIEHMERKLEERERSAGMSIEQAEAEAIQAVTEYNSVKESISTMETFIKRMKESLNKRMDRWNAFRMYLSVAPKLLFGYYMHKRGDKGTLRFNHSKQTLDVRVSTGDQFQEGSGRRKDSKSLSGGEKSFSQISLLLSLWDGISSPILCLDEFDVYMDAVNRKQSMKMMMDAAYDTASQYILITPQDASNMVPGPLVTVHRMADPERRQ